VLHRHLTARHHLLAGERRQLRARRFVIAEHDQVDHVIDEQADGIAGADALLRAGRVLLALAGVVDEAGDVDDLAHEALRFRWVMTFVRHGERRQRQNQNEFSHGSSLKSWSRSKPGRYRMAVPSRWTGSWPSPCR